MPSGIVSVTTGVMNPLLGKLTKLLGEEYKKLTGVRKQVSFLKDELGAMKALLDRMELMDKLDPSAKNWRDHVREMSYDMENCIDDFMHEIDGVDAKTGFVKKMAKRLRRLGRRHQIANRIEELKVLAVEANARRERYKIDDCINLNPGVVAVDPRISALYKEAAGLVGIHGPREELVSLLMDSKKELKVVLIVGSGGLGKTTLAEQVYDKIGGQFNCKAFISVSQRPDVKNLLVGLHRKLGLGESSDAHEVQDIIERLREYLTHNRYFIFVDDLWDQSAWSIISCAFPKNSNGSRVMITTRLDDVLAMACQSDCACIYRMRHLGEQDSKQMFFYRVFGSENICPPQFQDISAEILKKCGGLPLAIITIASLLASHEARSLNAWESINNSLGAKFATKPTLEEMRGILNLSYVHLPIHLRPCLLYLGMYPEDYEIRKDDLVQQWIAEGLVSSLHGVDLEEVATSYFNELINRSLIQPKTTYYGEVLSCRVHDMILDLILSKCTKENFISVAYNYEGIARLHHCEYKVRRLSLKSSVGGAISETLLTSMSQVRSYAWFGESMYAPPLTGFKYLRVLFFNFPLAWDRTIDLTAIGHLFLLKYLKVFAIRADVALPAEIQGLLHLETLELTCWYTRSFPSDITHLANLFHLELPDSTVLPKEIQNMKSLRTLNCLGVSGTVGALGSVIRQVRNLKEMLLDYEIEFDGLDGLFVPLPDPLTHLEVLGQETWTFSRVPKWIGELCYLRILNMRILHLSSDEVRVLGELPSLVSAFFHVSDVSQDKVVICTRLFPVLKVVQFMSDEDVSAALSFEPGGMSKLQRLTLVFGWKEWRGATPVGMECLPCLQDICVDLIFTDTESSKNLEDVHADVESAFKGAALVHPTHPSFSFVL